MASVMNESSVSTIEMLEKSMEHLMENLFTAELRENVLGHLDISYKNVILTAAFLVCLASYAYMIFSRTGWMLRAFPSAPKLPLVGSLPFMITSPEGVQERVGYAFSIYGTRFVNWFGHTPLLIVADADAVQKILSSTKYIEKGKEYRHFHWMLGEGLVTSNGKIWREDRKILSPSFKYQKFDGFLDSFNKHSKVFVDILSKDFAPDQKDALQKGLNLHPYLCRATMDFITESALGQPAEFQLKPDGEFIEVIYKTLESFRTRILKPYLNFPIIWDVFGCGQSEKHCTSVARKVVNEAIEKRKEVLSSGESGNSDDTKPFIDSILSSDSLEYITGHIVTIFGAGFETTASGMNYSLYMLANHPKIQEKVFAEIDSIFSGRDSNDPVTFADLAELKYLEMCIKEAMRLYPPVPAILRHATEDIPLDEKQVIPKGIDVLFDIRDLHRDPTHFPNPDVFDPERFLPDNCASRHPYAYIPFSAGIRNCLGLKYAMMQMKTCIAHVLRNFKVTTTLKPQDMKVIYGMVLEPSPHIPLILTPRRR